MTDTNGRVLDRVVIIVKRFFLPECPSSLWGFCFLHSSNGPKDSVELVSDLFYKS